MNKHMDKLEEDLRNNITGDVHFDSMSKTIYSVDASIYEVEPIGIVVPKTTQDVISAAAIAQYHHMPLIARGAGTGIVGGCIGRGLIIDTSKYLNQILKIDFEQGYAVCQPGVVQNQLNDALAYRGYRLGPDTSTGNRATLGGMVANNAAGARSMRYGKMVDCVQKLDLVLPKGEVINFSEISSETWHEKRQAYGTEGRIYRELFRIREDYHHEIAEHFPKIPRRVSGYNLDELIKPFPFNPCKLIVGSEGSLGIATKITVQICKSAIALGVVVIHFKSSAEAFESISQLLPFNPCALEMMDDKIINTGKLSPALRGRLQWLQGDPKVVFMAEFDGGSDEEVADKLNQFTSFVKSKGIGYAHTVVQNPQEMENVWALRKAGLGLLLSKRTYSRAIAFLEDLTVAPEHLAKMMESFQAYLKKVNKEAGIYGHVGSGCMHIRPYIDLRDPNELKLMKQMMLDVSDLILEHGGALSGEHGDGFTRSWLNEKMFGKKLYQAFKEIKKAFDPTNCMNPGKVIAEHDLLENLRLSPDMKKQKIDTFLDFSREGGIELAADLCNGNGQCRKKENLMCPSFQVTGDEFDTTRARAQGLRAIINGRKPLDSFTSPELYKVMDLCLECKGCKTECPSSVDMAKMKSEFLYRYHQKHGYPLRSRLFGHIGAINRLFSPISGFFNFMGNRGATKYILSLMGISPQRSLPSLAKERFSRWSKRNPSKKSKKQVVLFNDTYTEFNAPSIGMAAQQILSKLGYEVIVPPWSCCGRPLLSKGLLPQARKKAKQLIDLLLPYARKGLPIIGLEPSCILTVMDDYASLVNEKETLEVSKACMTLDQFLDKQVKEGAFALPWKDGMVTMKLHGHCHQKALVGTQPSLNVLKAIPGVTVSEIPSGCCGMAGSFGYEDEHYEFSLMVGETKLFPAIRLSEPSDLIVANGISCRGQIEHGTSRHALHLAEAILRCCE